jgi:hypothetical protein
MKENDGGRWRSIRRRMGGPTLKGALPRGAERLGAKAIPLPLAGRARRTSTRRPRIRWTPNLKAIVQALADDKPRRQIMAKLGIKKQNLSERIRRMKRAIGVETVEELLTYAREEGVTAAS